jgi:hypothetical protein
VSRGASRSKHGLRAGEALQNLAILLAFEKISSFETARRTESHSRQALELRNDGRDPKDPPRTKLKVATTHRPPTRSALRDPHVRAKARRERAPARAQAKPSTHGPSSPPQLRGAGIQGHSQLRPERGGRGTDVPGRHRAVAAGAAGLYGSETRAKGTMTGSRFRRALRLREQVRRAPPQCAHERRVRLAVRRVTATWQLRPSRSTRSPSQALNAFHGQGDAAAVGGQPRKRTRRCRAPPP